MTTNNTVLRAAGSVGVLILGLCVPIAAQATNGLYSLGFGTKQTGIAGSGVAFPQDALIASINPAGLAFLGRGNEVGVAIFSPRRSYEVTGASPPPPRGFPPFATDEIDSKSNWFIIPDLGFNWPLDENSAVGLAVYGNGGMNTDWRAVDSPFGVGTFGAAAAPGSPILNAGVDYAQLFVNLSYARKFTDTASWGIGALLNYSRIKMKGLAGFGSFSLNPARLTDQGYDSDTGLGLRLGIQGQVADGVTLAASYQSKISNTFEDYAGLFANGGEFDVPATAQAGVAWETGPGTFTLDVQHIFYTDVDTVGNTSTILPTQCIPSIPFTTALRASGPGCLGADLGFGWDDMTVVKAGYSWPTAGGWTWRVGASFGDQPIDEQEVTLNIIAPGVIEQHYTAGFSKQLNGNRELSASLMYAPEECVKGPDLFTPGKQVELCMYQYQVNVGYSF